MHRNAILAKFCKCFPSFPYNTLFIIYKTLSKHLWLLMRNNIHVDILRLIKVKPRLASELPLKFTKKETIQQLQVSCHKCTRTNCNRRPCTYLWMMSWIKSDWMTSFLFLKLASMDIYKLQLPNMAIIPERTCMI